MANMITHNEFSLLTSWTKKISYKNDYQFHTSV